MKQYIRLKDKWPYVIITLGTIIILALIYRGLDISMPILYQGGDEYGVFYIIKTIRDHGWYFYNPQVGGITGGEMYDYVYSDSLSFLLIKLISLFVNNIYAIGNIFYFMSYLLSALSSVYVCRKLNYSNSTSVLVGFLFAFSPYMQLRYAHMWLTPYYLLPLVCMVAVWIVKGEFIHTDGGLIKNKKWFQALIISFFSAFTGFYYAFFACVIYAIAGVIQFFNKKKDKIKSVFCPLLFIICTAMGVLFNALPNLIYWHKNGTNPYGELATRSVSDAEVYGLKLIQLILPRRGHRIAFLSNITDLYNQTYPLVNENSTASLGLIALIGLLMSLVWLFQNDNKNKYYSYFNISIFLVGTIGGIGSLFSLLVSTPMRSYNRISLLILFFSLLCIAEVLEQIKIKCSKICFGVIVFVLLCIGIYDQTANYYPSAEQQIALESTHNFVAEIEENMNAGDMIFQLPYVNWPSGGNYRMFSGYFESEKLRWSYGSMQGRSESVWQQSVAALYNDIGSMLHELKVADYDGIYIDSVVYANVYGTDELIRVLTELTQILNEDPIVSSNGELFFWDIRDYI